MTIKNAMELPKIYYGLHFYPGVAEYADDPDEAPYRVFVNEQTIRSMGPSFAGKPVYVRHVNEVKLKTLQQDADGYVMESFFNAADGKHWVKFIVVSDKGHEAIRNGWRLSNAYVPLSMAPGGIHNGVEFHKEVVQGEFEHLAIVDNPRYEESEIMTPEQFKAYNAIKESELLRLANSKDKPKGERKMKFNLFSKKKIENSADLESTMVELPLSKKEMTIANALTEFDKILNMHGYANGDHMVKVGEDEMSVNDLIKGYGEMKANAEKLAGDKKENAEDDESVDNAEDDESMDNDQDEKPEPEVKNEEKKEPELANKKKNASDVKKPKTEKKGHFEAVLNASDTAVAEEETIDLAHNQVARGKSRYGSGS